MGGGRKPLRRGELGTVVMIAEVGLRVVRLVWLVMLPMARVPLGAGRGQGRGRVVDARDVGRAGSGLGLGLGRCGRRLGVGGEGQGPTRVTHRQ